MPRLKADPVDIAFRAWAALDTEGKQRLADRVAGYQEAMEVVNGDKPDPRTRQRKVKSVGKPNGADTHSTMPSESGIEMCDRCHSPVMLCQC